MATCSKCFRTITNHHCPHCEEEERSKIRFDFTPNPTTYRHPSTPSNPYQDNHGGGNVYGGKKLPATTGEIIFNVIAAIVIIGICLFVAYQVMISA
ncbi:hypothetical protein MXF13_00935 [Leclercia adecarboxylata]|uniref:hypothetical protein n=1 Tax=Leclercia adecarboxylata TaxID=83655 RepID=UPI002DBCCFA4|nr:hypothetical protein [Leclercia adecarboxylata]MEB5748452.1 hypothetical protein [Leclercia adecarboxylata]